jgi:hypothetical protein
MRKSNAYWPRDLRSWVAELEEMLESEDMREIRDRLLKPTNVVKFLNLNEKEHLTQMFRRIVEKNFSDDYEDDASTRDHAAKA